jgi:hypothetical protein
MPADSNTILQNASFVLSLCNVNQNGHTLLSIQARQPADTHSTANNQHTQTGDVSAFN